MRYRVSDVLCRSFFAIFATLLLLCVSCERQTPQIQKQYFILQGCPSHSLEIDRKHDATFQVASELTGLDPCLLKAQLLKESNLDPRAKSNAGACGCAQFLPATWNEQARKHNVRNWSIWNCDQAILLGAMYVYQHYSKYIGEGYSHEDAQTLALASYNAGQGRVRKLLNRAAGVVGDIVLPGETKNYIKRINQQMILWRRR